MPIEVHCPNPVCARVHLVKNRYAGMRGRCPACSSWMYVPLTPIGAPKVESSLEAGRSLPDFSIPATTPATGLASPSRANPVAVEDPDPPLDHPFDEPPPRTRRPRRTGKVELPAVSGSPAVEEAPQETADGPKRRFSWFGAILVLLGSLAMGAVAAAPWLPTSSVEITGNIGAALGQTKVHPIDADFGIYTSLVPGAIAGLTLLLFVAGAVARRQGLVTLFLLDLVVIASALVMTLAVQQFQDEMKAGQTLAENITAAGQQGAQGDARRQTGPQVYVAGGAAVAACLFFLLAVLFIHHSWWARILAFVVLAAVLALGPLVLYRSDVGLQDVLPDLDPRQFLQSVTS